MVGRQYVDLHVRQVREQEDQSRRHLQVYLELWLIA
jgi:hypothetical protein